MITASVVPNYSEKGIIRLELRSTMPDNEGFPKVKESISRALIRVLKKLKTPVPDIGILIFDSHKVELIIRHYVVRNVFWELAFTVYKAIKKTFSGHQIQAARCEGEKMRTIGE